MTTELPDDVMAYLRAQATAIGPRPGSLEKLLAKYAPEWYPGDVVKSRTCTSVRRDDLRWACSLSTQVSHPADWTDTVHVTLLVRKGKPVQP